MKPLSVIFFFQLGAFLCQGQPGEKQCFFSVKKGLVFSHRLLVLPIDQKRFLMEYYTYGGGIFSGAPYADTLRVDGELIKSTVNEMAINIEKHRITLRSNGHKLKFRFKVVGKCDSIVNRTRNWPAREELRYKIKDEKKSWAFEKKTDPLLSTLCFPEFVVKVSEILRSLE